ncbi:MAG TPA: hypothetical protein VMF90_21000 [Rhizobiaceae bacterium]|nr:hypothetical protein [Rhizobiaceae bacterium]
MLAKAMSVLPKVRDTPSAVSRKNCTLIRPLVIACCSSRKAMPATVGVETLPTGELRDVVSAWLDSVDGAMPTATAATMYRGRSFRYAKQAAMMLDAEIDILSAGLGYVRGEAMIPSYDLAAGRGPGGVAPRISKFKPEKWWAAVNRGRFAAERLPEIESRPVVMIALTRDYARMVRPMLEQLAAHADRIRIFGAGLASYLPRPLHCCFMPYDEGMDLKGTKGDFAGRALLTHARLLTEADSYDLASEREAVAAMMTCSPRSNAPSRKTVSDDVIVQQMTPWLREEPKISNARILRRLRDLSGIACSEERARRIMMGLME